MISLKCFTFNDYQENTYILFDESKECVIIDPGCYTDSEKEELLNFIRKNQLNPVRLLNTHCHIDHILGNKFCSRQFDLLPEYHKLENGILKSAALWGMNMGIFMDESPEAASHLNEGDMISFGKSELKVILMPGHSPGSLGFYDASGKIIIAGDVLFYMSIGRTDLPGGDHATLISSIREKLLTLGNDVKVFPGHGPSTSTGFEKDNNPFLSESFSASF